MIKINIIKGRKISVFLWIFFLYAGSFSIAQNTSTSLNQDEFEVQLFESISAGNDTLFRLLIHDNRLMVKPAFLKLTEESLKLELDGNQEEAKQDMEYAELIAINFNEIFNEKCLLIVVDDFKNLTIQQKKLKFKADSLNNLGTSLRSSRETSGQAIEHYLDALKIYEKIGDDYGQAFVLGGLGLIYSSLDYQTSYSYYQKALEIRQMIDDKQLIGNSLNSIGTIYYNYFNDYEQAIVYYDKAATIRKEIEDWWNLGNTITYKAVAYEKLDQYESAIKYFKQSCEINSRSGNRPRMAEALIKSGAIQVSIGKYNEALEDFEVSLGIYREINDTVGIGDVLTQMGFAYTLMGDYTTAIEKCTEALQLMIYSNDTWGMAGAYNNMGIIYQSAKRLDKAAEYYEKALNNYEELQDIQSIIITLTNIGTVYHDQGDYAKAEEYHSRGLQLSREINSKLNQMNCLLNIANDQSRLKKFDEAYSNYQESLQLAESLNNPEVKWKTIVGMAENFEERGEYEKAIELNEKGLAIIEEIRRSIKSDEFKATYMARERYVFEDVINMLCELHEKDNTNDYDVKSFQLAEQSKSRALLDLLAESLANVSEGADTALLAEQDKILAELNRAKHRLEAKSTNDNADEQLIMSLKEDIRNHEEALNALKTEIRETNPKYAELQYPQPVSLNELQIICLDKNTIMLEYSLGDTSSWLWVINRNSLELIKLSDRNTLKEQIELMRFALQNPEQVGIEFFTEVSYRLYQHLIQPAEPYIPKNCNLVIIPDGILNYLPFEVLLTNREKSSEKQFYADLSYLVLNHPINYAQSANVLYNLLATRDDESNTDNINHGLIAFGDPVYANENDPDFLIRKGLGRLEYSGREVERIACFFPEKESKTFLRETATEENLKTEHDLAKFKYIHFATHGLIDEQNPDFSSLVFTQGINSEEDGFLQVPEIFNLRLNASLVVLSACQTGLGKMIRGEGMVGLTRAFLYAGTPSVVVSLWNVSDFSTSNLMEEFYRNLIENNLAKTKALQKAQLSMIKNEQYAHPFYWAPFILLGDWQ
jgi:CHAT domain-containing protein/tetratricopeptide (TPR) repeat protein